MMIVTGGAGFIGSCIVRTLNDMGIEDIIIVDHIGKTDKWLNLRNKKYLEYIGRDRLPERLPAYAGRVTHVIHMGACSATTEKDFDFLCDNNVAYSKMLWDFCAKHQISFLYASSAATYGDGSIGFDDQKGIESLRPLNGYGYSKQLFDLWAERQSVCPGQHVGFKFFNVYGPNEYFKGEMASVVFHTFCRIRQKGEMRLFKSYREGCGDGMQSRDFIYVKDICRVIRFMIEHPHINGLFNLGTGKARTFYDLAAAVFSAMGMEPNIKYVEMPAELRDKYQYYTRADMKKLYAAGCGEACYSLEDGIRDYVQGYLLRGCEVY